MTRSELEDRLAFPGDRLCPADDLKYQSGPGTYVLNGFIYSSLLGRVAPVAIGAGTESSDKKSGRDGILSVEVRSPKSVVGGGVDGANGRRHVVPAQGDVVTAKVLAVNPRFAKLQIVCVRDAALPEPYRAQLRREDVRATEKDRVEMYKTCRPGDVLLCRVLSLGEASSGYLVTTAENELGVVIAHSEASGSKMIPVSWTEMQCPETYSKEPRKIAKVCPENLAAFAATSTSTS